MGRLEKMSDQSIIRLALRVTQQIDNLMTCMGESGENPYGFGGALSYGWDWPTANVYYPRLCSLRRKICAIAAARNLSAKFTRYRPTRGKNRGKILYELAA